MSDSAPSAHEKLHAGLSEDREYRESYEAARQLLELAGQSAHDLVLQCAAWSRPNREAGWIASMIGVWIGARVYWAERGRDYLHLTISADHEDRLLAVLPEVEREYVKLQHEKLRQYRIKLPERANREIAEQ